MQVEHRSNREYLKRSRKLQSKMKREAISGEEAELAEGI